jgi:hypothetical protein
MQNGEKGAAVPTQGQPHAQGKKGDHCERDEPQT